VSYVSIFFFFFQAEDGIRDYKVTGVQTCALPISDDDRVAAAMAAAEQRRRERDPSAGLQGLRSRRRRRATRRSIAPSPRSAKMRSEERRVGKEGRSRWSPDH